MQIIISKPLPRRKSHSLRGQPVILIAKIHRIRLRERIAVDGAEVIQISSGSSEHRKHLPGSSSRKLVFFENQARNGNPAGLLNNPLCITIAIVVISIRGILRTMDKEPTGNIERARTSGKAHLLAMRVQVKAKRGIRSIIRYARGDLLSIQGKTVSHLSAIGIADKALVIGIEAAAVDLRHAKGIHDAIVDGHAVAAKAKAAIAAIQDRHPLKRIIAKSPVPTRIRGVTILPAALPHAGKESAVVDLYIAHQ
jgi:hypothetical protein